MNQEKTARDVMEEAKRELEEQARIDEINRGQNPAVPATDLDEDDGVPTYEIPPEHQVPPQQVIEEEDLGVR